MIKRIIFIFVFTGLLWSEARSWDLHSAYLLPQKQWEVGLFQPFRYGYAENLEYSVHPIWFFVMPNIAIKRNYSDFKGFKTAGRFKLIYPTPLLNMLSRTGIGGVIAPEFEMPPMLGLSATWLMSNEFSGLGFTFNGGFDAGLVGGDLDNRTTIDLPLVYHRLGVFYNKWGTHFGVDIQKDFSDKIQVLFDLDLHLLPGSVNAQSDTNFEKLMGEYSFEHKLIISWNKSSKFRIMTGYKFVKGTYPYGSDMRLLPYIPMVEKWVPFIEMQWSGVKN